MMYFHLLPLSLEVLDQLFVHEMTSQGDDVAFAYEEEMGAA